MSRAFHVLSVTALFSVTQWRSKVFNGSARLQLHWTKNKQICSLKQF